MTIIKYDCKKKIIISCFNTDLKRTLVVQQPQDWQIVLCILEYVFQHPNLFLRSNGYNKEDKKKMWTKKQNGGGEKSAHMRNMQFHGRNSLFHDK